MEKGFWIAVAVLLSGLGFVLSLVAGLSALQTVVLVLNAPIIVYLVSSLSGMRRGASRRMAAPLLFFLAIAIAESVFAYFSANLGVIIHIGVVVAAIVSSVYLGSEDSRIVHAFILVSLLRIVNVALPLQGIYIYYQFLVIYSLLLVSAVFYMHAHGLGLVDVGLNRLRGSWLLAGSGLGVLYGFSEYSVIGLSNVIPRFLLASFFVFFLLGTVEEIIFRGILQTSLKEIDPLFAILLSAVVFGTMHSIWVKPFEYVFTFYVGAVLALIYHKTGSLSMPIATHTVINFVLFQVIPFKLAF
jgi:membrane protease YdiL (CAAX protease family)